MLLHDFLGTFGGFVFQVFFFYIVAVLAFKLVGFDLNNTIKTLWRKIWK